MNYTELSQLTKKFDKRHYLWSSICGVKSKKYTRKACLLGFEKKKKKEKIQTMFNKLKCEKLKLIA